MEQRKISFPPLVRQSLCFIVCLMLMMVVPIWRDHKLFGIDLTNNESDTPETLTITDNGFIINTTEIGKDIIGYAGVTPVEITVADGKIVKIKALDNRETPEYYGAVLNSDLLESLDGLTLSEAISKKLDGVSGATFSSNAIIANIKVGIAYALKENDAIVASSKTEDAPSLKFYVTLVIILAGGIVPLFLKDRRYRTLQLILNVVILGFWGGTFLCYTAMTSFMSNGIKSVLLIPVALMLVAAFIYPFFGKKNYYCLWLCPYGSIQELAGKCVKKKISISPAVVKWLNLVRNLLWFALMWLLWTGLWFDWMGYEPFAAFFFTNASPVVLGIAGGFLILSLFVPRPYCRFVCPIGSLFKLAEGNLN